MSLKFETVAVDARIATIASLIEDLGAVKRHKIAPDNHKARHALARYARSLQERYSDAFGDLEVTPEVRAMIEAAVAGLRADRAHLAKVQREKREADEAERIAIAAMNGLILTPENIAVAA